MTFRVYLRDANQQVTHKTTTDSSEAAFAAFSALIDRTEYEGRALLAVFNADGRPIAHHDFRVRPDGSPINPTNYWRGRLSEITIPRRLTGCAK